MTHAELVLRAERWLLSIGCGITFTELVTAAMETPDVIGWKSHMSILIEVKASRSDFYRDKTKAFRRNPERGMGCWRFFLCEPGVIQPASLPPGWGLLYAEANCVRRVHGVPDGNAFWGPAPFTPSRENEIIMLLSALRRLKIRGHLPSIYDPAPAKSNELPV